ncbi:MAG: zinc ribbon domain-containing protein [Candidatus Dormiibacterota bacterium]
MAAQVRFCGRCGAQLAPGAAFCGRCGTPQGAQAVAATAVYSYPVAHRATYPTVGQFKLSQGAVAGGMLVILAIVTVVVSMFAVSHVLGGNHSTCTVNCAPKILTPLPESSTYRSSAYKFEVDYSSSWTVRSQDASGIALGTKIGLVQVTGTESGQPLDQVLQAAVASLPSAQWQDVVQVSDLKGAHIGDQDGLGAVYSANLIGANSTSAQVRFAVTAATRGGVTVVIFAADPADPKSSPHGIPEAQQFDYLCTEFRWG